MKNFKAIAGVNLAILAIYTVLIRVFPPHGDNEGLGIVIISCYIIIIHVVINGILAVVFSGDKPISKSFMLSALVVAIIGFATCTMIH